MTADETWILHQLDARAAAEFLSAVAGLVEAHPHPLGASLRLTVTAVDSGEQLGQVDVDVTNLWDLGRFADRRAAASFEPAPQAPRLQLLRGGA